MRAAWRWRARQAALKAGQGAASGLVASAAHGNEVRPQSAARQGTAGRFGRHGDDGGASPSAWRGVCVNGQGAAASGVCAQVGWGVSGAARQRGGSEAARPRQWRSEAASARALKCLRARAEQRGEREKEWREERKCQRFDSVKTQDLQLKLEKF